MCSDGQTGGMCGIHHRREGAGGHPDVGLDEVHSLGGQLTHGGAAKLRVVHHP